MSQKVNIAVCGKYHVLKYIDYISSDISKVYFSARLKYEKSLRLPKQKVVNLYLKEYLIQTHGLLFGTRYYEEMTNKYFNLWEKGVIKQWEDCDIFHFLSHGACLDVIKRAKLNGSKVLCEVVNTHPAFRQNIIREQADIWNVNLPKDDLFPREIKAIQESEQSDFLLCPSESVIISYRKMGYSGEIFKIPYVSDTKRFLGSTRSFPSSKIKILSVGRIGLRKGQLYLLEALVSQGDIFDLTLVGTIDPEVKKLLENYEFNHIERVPHSEMPRLYSEHDVYVSSSLEEGLSLSIGEALANGLVVLATNESGGTELIKDGHNGFVIESKSSDSINEKLTYIIENPDCIQRISRNGINSAVSEFNWKNYAVELKNTYQSITDN